MPDDAHMPPHDHAAGTARDHPHGHPHAAGPGTDVVVVGAGAVGTFVAAVLARGGLRIGLLDRHGPAVPAPDRLAVQGVDPFTAEVLRCADAAALGEPGAVVLAVKQPDVAGALAAAAPWPRAVLVTLQNGLGAEEAAAAVRPGTRVVAASLTTPVAPVPGGVARLGRGGLGLAVAAPGGADPEAAAVAAVLSRAARAGGLRTVVLPHAAAMKWSKLLANLVGNATAALLAADPAAVYADPAGFDLERRQLLETLAVMRRLRLAPAALPGAPVPLLALAAALPAPLGRRVLGAVVGRARGGKLPSLRLDLDAGRGRTEAAWLNGAVAAAAARAGLAAPVNAALAALVEEAAADPAVRADLAGDPRRLRAAVEARTAAGTGAAPG